MNKNLFLVLNFIGCILNSDVVFFFRFILNLSGKRLVWFKNGGKIFVWLFLVRV